MRHIAILGVVFAVIFSFASAYGGRPQELDKSMDARRLAYLDAFNKAEARAIKALYSDNAVLLSYDGRTIRGSDMISAGMAMMAGQAELDLIPAQSRSSGDLAYETGTWRHRKKGTKDVMASGGYLWVWHKNNKGIWSIDSQSVTMVPTRNR
jgi:ketosteroid isomerase-like protein